MTSVSCIESVIKRGEGTHHNLHPQGRCRYQTEEGEGQPESSKPLKASIQWYITQEGVAAHTNISPRVARAMDLIRGCQDVCCVAKVWQPHVLNVSIIKCLRI